MYWYLEEERPVHRIRKIRAMREDGTWDKLSKDKQVTIARSLLEWQAAQGKYLFHPNKKELKYFLRNGLIEPFAGAISGGNRSGKTATHAIDVISQIEGWHPLQRENLLILSEKALDPWVRAYAKKVLDNKAWIASPPVHARVVAIDFPNYVDKIIGPEIEKWLTNSMVDPSDIAYENQNRRIIKWKKDSPARGGFLEFMTQAQPLKAHGGSARHVVWIDEEIAQEYWSESAMRVITVNGRMLYGATAVEGISWTEEALFVPAEKGSDKVYFMEMSTYDNPVNTKKVIDKILSQCTDKTDIDIRIHGKRKRKGGVVFKMAKDESPWIIERFNIPKDKGILIFALDPHPQMEHAGLWCWVDYDGIHHDIIDGKPNIYEVGEFFENGTIDSIKYYIEMVELQIGRKHDFFLADPWIWNTEQLRPEEKSLYDQLIDNGFYPQKGSKDRTANILRVGHLLSLAHEKITEEEKVKSLVNPEATLSKYPDAHPRLMAFSDLNRLRYERRNWHYPTYKGVAAGLHNKIKSTPVDKDDHILEDEGRIAAFIDDFEVSSFVRATDEPDGRRPTMYTSDGEELMIDWGDEKLGFDQINDF